MRAKKTRINGQIRVPKVRLIDENGNQVGVVETAEALARAQQVELDLVEISPNADPPVCRIRDYGKYQFEQSKRVAAQKKKQKQTKVKEVKFRPSTDIGDYNIKLRKIISFLVHGDKVKISLRFRGREMQHRELGMNLLKRIENDLEDIVVEQVPRLEGRQMTMVVAKAKADVHKKTKENEDVEDKN